MRSVGLSLVRSGRAGTMQNQGKKATAVGKDQPLCIFSFPDQLQCEIPFMLLKLLSSNYHCSECNIITKFFKVLKNNTNSYLIKNHLQWFHSSFLSKDTYLGLMVANLLITRQQRPLDSICVAEDGQSVLGENPLLILLWVFWEPGSYVAYEVFPCSHRTLVWRRKCDGF